MGNSNYIEAKIKEVRDRNYRYAYFENHNGFYSKLQFSDDIERLFQNIFEMKEFPEFIEEKCWDEETGDFIGVTKEDMYDAVCYENYSNLIDLADKHDTIVSCMEGLKSENPASTYFLVGCNALQSNMDEYHSKSIKELYNKVFDVDDVEFSEADMIELLEDSKYYTFSIFECR